MNPIPRLALVVAVFSLVAACGQGLTEPEPLGTTEGGLAAATRSSGETRGATGRVDTDEDGEDELEPLKECLAVRWRFTGWESQPYTTREDKQDAPVTGASSFHGSITHSVYSNPTGGPSVISPSTSQCTTSTATLSVSSSLSTTLSQTVTLPGFQTMVSGTAVTTGTVTTTQSHCNTPGAGQTFTLQPGDRLFCSLFNGVETSTTTIRLWQQVWNGTRHCKVYEPSRPCIPGKRYGECVNGTGTASVVELGTISMTVTLPMASVRCNATAYPTSPF